MLDPSPAFDFSSFPVPRDLIENAPIGIFQSCMTTRRFTWMNQVMARCLGYDSPSACIDSIKDIPRDLYLRSANRRLLMDRVETRGQIFNFESRFRRRDGGVVRGKIHARVAPGGELLEGFFENMGRAPSNDIFRLIFESTGVATAVVDADMVFTRVNDAFLRALGYERHQVEGQMTWTQMVPLAEDQKRMGIYHRQRRCAGGDSPPDQYEFTLMDGQGRRRRARIRVNMVPGTEKSIVSLVEGADYARRPRGRGQRFCGIVGESPSMQRVYERVLSAKDSDANVIIYGESGTGKELVARAIHTMGHRRAHRFVPVHCGAIPSHLLESEFFGHKRGAFTGALKDTPGFFDHARGGSLFLDELGEIDGSIQVKLLRVLEGNGFTPVGGREVKSTQVRIIAATNRNLNDLVRRGRMREDFFYRIHILPIYLPPLRERKDDIPLLVAHFMEKYNIGDRVLSPGMMDALMAHDWPGNVRELENSIQRLSSLPDSEFILAPDPFISRDDTGNTGGEMGLSRAVESFERSHIRRALEMENWNRRATAVRLGIGRKTLYRKMKHLAIP